MRSPRGSRRHGCDHSIIYTRENVVAHTGSLFLTRPTLFTYASKRADLLAMAAELFEAVASGKVRIEINQRYRLSEASRAHRDLEARLTTGSTVLLP